IGQTSIHQPSKSKTVESSTQTKTAMTHGDCSANRFTLTKPHDSAVRALQRCLFKPAAIKHRCPSPPPLANTPIPRPSCISPTLPVPESNKNNHMVSRSPTICTCSYVELLSDH